MVMHRYGKVYCVMLFIFLFTSFLTGMVGAQDISGRTLDFSNARISIAGPDSFFIRSVDIDGTEYSMTLEIGDDGKWKLGTLTPSSSDLIPSETYLDLASISQKSDGSFQINGIILEGKVYKGELALNGQTATDFLNGLEESGFSNDELKDSSVAKALESVLVADAVAQAQAVAAEEVAADLAAAETRIKDALAEKVSLQEALTEEKTEKLRLELQVQNLQKDKAELLAWVDNLLNESDDLNDRVEELETQLGAYQASSDPVTESAFIAEMQLLKNDLAGLSAEVKSLSEQIESGASTTVVTTPVDGAADSTVVSANAQAELEKLRSENIRIKSILAEYEATLAKGASVGTIAMLKPKFTNIVYEGFGGSSVQIGDWALSSTQADQVDGEQYFAKLTMPVKQQAQPTLYSFKAKSTGRGWVGLGLHIFVDDVRARGYGLGKSLLVWLTRDFEVHRNNNTYLQVYRSDDDVNMGRVLDGMIQDPIDQYIAIDVLYDPIEEYIAIAVNGVEKLRYKTWFDLEAGIQVALRSLGDGASFKDFSVRTIP